MGEALVKLPTPTTKTNPQPTNTMSTQLENLTRETSTPLHQLLSDKKIKKRLHWKCGTTVQSPFYENDPLDAKLSCIQQKILTHMAKYTVSLAKCTQPSARFSFFSRMKNCTLMLKCLIKKKFSVDVFCLDNRLEELYLRQAGSAVVNCTFE